MNQTFKKSLLTIAISTTLAACGGGGGTGSVDGTTEITSSGTITGFGSAVVNGVRYETTAARVVRDDGSLIIENPSDDELQEIVGEGNILKVRGTLTDDSNGTADTITVDDETVGDIESGSINPDLGTFKVNGQTIFVMPDTIIDDSIIGNSATADAAFSTLDTTLDVLLSGITRVEVAGFPVDGGIEATRIEDFNGSATAGTGELGEGVDEIKGFVSDLVPDVSFKINETTVIFDAETIFDDNFILDNGQLVEVHGTPAGPTTFDATRIELEDDLFDDDFSGEFEVEGVIQSIVPDGIGGGDVVFSHITVTVDDISGLSEGMRVEIKGILQADGSVVVTRVKDEQEDTVRTEDIAVSEDGDSFVTRLGLDIMPSSRSRLEDDTIEDDDNLSIADFLGNVVDKRIEARGFPMNDTIAWTRLEIEDDNDLDCSLRGPVAEVIGTDSSDFSFTIDGGNIDVTINVDEVSDNNFEGSNDLPIGRQAFFDLLEAGVVVEASSIATGGCNSGELTARQVEFEPADDVLFSDDNGGLGDDNVAGGNDEIFGSVSEVTDTSFVIDGETITVNDSTVIDNSIIEDSRGVELDITDQPLGSIEEVLTELLNEGGTYIVVVDRSGDSPVALEIED